MKKINVNNWKFEVQGTKLRNAIDVNHNDDNIQECANIISEMRKILVQGLGKFPDLEDLYYLTEGEDTVQGLEEMLNEPENYGFDSLEDIVNSRLEEFWNLMDDNRIYVSL